jgi:2,3-dihydroxybenzoate decarboxylase
MVRKIALEEHFLSPGFEDYWLPTMGNVDRRAVDTLLARLKDFGDARLEGMESAGIARSVLSISGPGVQSERDTATARWRADEGKDFLSG